MIPRWSNYKSCWDDAEIIATMQRCASQIAGIPSRNQRAILAAIDEQDLDTLVRALLCILPTCVADALEINGVQKINKAIPQTRIETGISDVLCHILTMLPRLLTMQPYEIKGYLSKRCKSLIRKSVRSEWIGHSLERTHLPANYRPHRSGEITEPVSSPPNYWEATRVLAELALRLAPIDLRDLLSDVCRGVKTRDAIRAEANRRAGRPGLQKKDDSRRAAIIRELAQLGAIVAAAAPDWALCAWSDRWDRCLVAA